MKRRQLVIHCLGASNTQSSICGRDGERFLYTQEINYPALLQKKLDCTVRNCGVGGCNIARQEGRQDSYVERYPLMEDGADVVLVQGRATMWPWEYRWGPLRIRWIPPIMERLRLWWTDCMTTIPAPLFC